VNAVKDETRRRIGMLEKLDDNQSEGTELFERVEAKVRGRRRMESS
jgi:hypothetical protein